MRNARPVASPYLAVGTNTVTPCSAIHQANYTATLVANLLGKFNTLPLSILSALCCVVYRCNWLQI
jgi:hypothetical protein